MKLNSTLKKLLHPDTRHLFLNTPSCNNYLKGNVKKTLQLNSTL